MQKQPDPRKKYRGIVPETEEELPKARKQLELYFLLIWEDIVQAAEIAMAINRDNYREKITEYLRR